MAAAEAGLAAMTSGEATADTVAAVFRAVHSIKGGSGAFGHSALLAFSHRFENVLDEVRSGAMPATPAVVQLLLRASDILADHIAAAKDGTAPPADAAMLAELDALLGGSDAPAAAPAVDEFGFAPATATLDLGDDEFGFAPVAVALDDLDAPAAGWRVRFRPSPAALANGGEPLLVLREIERLAGEVTEVDHGELPDL